MSPEAYALLADLVKRRFVQGCATLQPLRHRSNILKDVNNNGDPYLSPQLTQISHA